PARFAGQNQLVGQAAGGVGLDEPDQVFAGLQGAEVEQVGWRDVVFVENGRHLRLIRHGLQSGVYAWVNDVDLVGRDAVQLDQILFGSFGISHDAAGAT